MTEYTYGNITYTKRPITDCILLHVICDDPAKIRTEAYEMEALITKGAELASQMDACPMVGRDLIIPVYNRIRKEPGMRARDVETGSCVTSSDFSRYTAADAIYQISCGTLANIAAAYPTDLAELMLSRGILPLTSTEDFPVGTLLYIKGIRQALENTKTTLEAYRFEDGDFIPVQIGIEAYEAADLRAILQ